MKLKSLVILLFFVCYHAVSQETVYIEADKQIGRGILRARGNECFVITPAHVVQESLNEVAIIGAKIVESIGKLQQTLSSDLAIVRVTGGGLQKCEEWEIAANYNEVLENAFEGFLEVKSSNGSNKLIKVLLTEKEDSYTTIRPYFQDDKLIKGLSGSSLFCSVDGKKVFMGLLMEVDENGKGIVLNANTINKLTGDFFKVIGTSVEKNLTTPKVSMIVATPSENVIEENGFRFQLISFKRSGSNLIGRLMVTSLTKDIELGFYADYSNVSTKIYDENGLEFIASNVRLSSISNPNYVGNEYTLVKGVQVPLEFIFKDFPSNSQGITLFKLFYQNRVNNQNTELKFRNISLGSSLKLQIPHIEGVEKVNISDSEIQLLGFKRSGSNLIGSLMVTSLSKDTEAGFYADYSNVSTKIYDENGLEFIASNVRLSSISNANYVGNEYTLVRGVQVPLEFTFKDFPSNSQGITLFKLYYQNRENNQNTELKFRNISLGSSLKFQIPHIEGVEKVNISGSEIQLLGFKRSGSNLIGSLMVTSLSKDTEAGFYADYSNVSTKIYDENGLEFVASNVRLSSYSNTNYVGNDYTLVKGVQVPLEFTFKDFPSNSQGITLFKLFYQNRENNQNTELKFRNISLGSSLKFQIPHIEGVEKVNISGSEIQLLGFKRNGSSLIGSLMVTSLSKDTEAGFYADYSNVSTKIYDENGSEFVASNVRLSSNSNTNYVGNDYTLVKGVQVPLEFTFKDFPSNSQAIALFKLFYQNRENNQNIPLTFKNKRISL